MSAVADNMISATTTRAFGYMPSAASRLEARDLATVRLIWAAADTGAGPKMIADFLNEIAKMKAIVKRGERNA